jgi:hypothetical protein
MTDHVISWAVCKFIVLHGRQAWEHSTQCQLHSQGGHPAAEGGAGRGPGAGGAADGIP